MAEREQFVIVGGSIAGLASALALARSGGQVTVLERDPIPVVPDPEAAFAVDRAGAPQTHALHVFLARLVLILQDRYPDILEALAAIGVHVEDNGQYASFGDGLGNLMARRSTFEWVLRRTILDEPSVSVRTGTAVTALIGDGARAGRPPEITGVTLDDGTMLRGTVVACNGRRSDLNAWLSEFGVEVPEEVVRSERVYCSRWYRTTGDARPPTTMRDLDFLSYLLCPADAGTFSVGIGTDPADKEMRSYLYDDTAFNALSHALPLVGEWLDDYDAEPIRPVRAMTGLINRRRSFLDHVGRPRVLGFHAVGDAHTCTNPAYGRGCTLAFLGATLLADAVTAHPDDPMDRAIGYEAACAAEIEPWYHNAVRVDLQARKPDAGPTDEESKAFEISSRLVGLGLVDDPVVIGGLASLFNLLITPERLFSDENFIARMRAAVDTAPEAPAGPNRSELLAAAGLYN